MCKFDVSCQRVGVCFGLLKRSRSNYCFQFLLVMSGWTCAYFLSHHAAFEAFSGPKDVYEQEFFTENRVVHLRTLDSGLLTSLGEQEWHGHRHGAVCIAL